MKYLFFDLDGTLLPMNYEEFIKGYFSELCKKFVPLGYEKEKLIDGVWTGTKQMVLNDGNKTNEEVFWSAFHNIFGDRVYEDKYLFDEFYQNEFDNVKSYCGYEEKMNSIIKKLKQKDFSLVIASNPIFPMVAQLKRMKWAGLDEKDFQYITSYENSHYSKPNPKYFNEIINTLNINKEDCIMIGNDALEDAASVDVGIDFFLLTDCMINTKNKDISIYKNGSINELCDFLGI